MASAQNGKVAVGAGSTVVLAADAGRGVYEFTNDSDEVIYLARGEAAVLNEGIRLNANGGSWSTDYLGAINAICASGGKNLCYSGD